MATETIKRCDKCGAKWIVGTEITSIEVTIDVRGTVVPAGGPIRRVFDFCGWICFRNFTFHLS
jgi:hypothetical protein